MVEWFRNCNVVLTGQNVEDNRAVVGLTDGDGAFADRQFYAADAVRKELLATALTAIGTGQLVQAAVDDGAPEFGTLHALYVTSRLPTPPEPTPVPPPERWASLGG